MFGNYIIAKYILDNFADKLTEQQIKKIKEVINKQ